MGGHLSESKLEPGRPTRRSGRTQALTKFFAAFRQHSLVSSTELYAFFSKFEKNYTSARLSRAAATPHLDVLRVFGLEFRELRHSDALAWFLDPHAEHEQGPLFANALLGLAGFKEVSIEGYAVKREHHERTDISFYARSDFAVFIENKVRHFERAKQVSDMVDSLITLSEALSIPREYRFAIFLTDSGARPITGPTADTSGFLVRNLRSLRRIDIFEAFATALNSSSVYSPLLMNLIECYIGAIRRLRAQLA